MTRQNFLVFSVAFLVSGSVFAEKEEAAFTISGKKNGPVTIVDHTQSEPKPLPIEPMRLNQATPEAIEQYRAYRKSREDARLAAEEAARKAAAESGEVVPELDVAPAGEEIDVEKGLELLRERNWVTYTSDDRRFPQQVYNPETKQFVPTLEAIESLQRPEAPVTRESLVPPPPRRVESGGVSIESTPRAND